MLCVITSLKTVLNKKIKIHAIYIKKKVSVYFQSGADSGNYKLE